MQEPRPKVRTSGAYRALARLRNLDTTFVMEPACVFRPNSDAGR
jgi:hypothetical protein